MVIYRDVHWFLRKDDLTTKRNDKRFMNGRYPRDGGYLMFHQCLWLTCMGKECCGVGIVLAATGRRDILPLVTPYGWMNVGSIRECTAYTSKVSIMINRGFETVMRPPTFSPSEGGRCPTGDVPRHSLRVALVAFPRELGRRIRCSSDISPDGLPSQNRGKRQRKRKKILRGELRPLSNR